MLIIIAKTDTEIERSTHGNNGLNQKHCPYLKHTLTTMQIIDFGILQMFLGLFDLRDADQAKEYLDRIGVEYRFQCYHENRPDGCHRLGDYLDAFKHDWEKARLVYKMNCEKNLYGQSCFKYGNYSLLGRGGAKSMEEAFGAFTKGCDNGYSASCHNAGLMHHAGQIGKKDFVKSAELLKRGCDAGNAPSCQMLSAYFITGMEGVEKDMKKAFEYAVSACEKGHMYACANVSRMYKLGEGAEQNQELSDKYKKRARELFRDVSESQRPILSGE